MNQDQYPEKDDLSKISDEDHDLDHPDFTTSKKWQLSKYVVSGLVLIALILPGILFLFNGQNTNPEETKTKNSNNSAITVPNFSLPDSNGNEIVLADIAGKNELVILVFYRGYF